jgi:hypothetical protein
MWFVIKWGAAIFIGRSLYKAGYQNGYWDGFHGSPSKYSTEEEWQSWFKRQERRAECSRN